MEHGPHHHAHPETRAAEDHSAHQAPHRDVGEHAHHGHGARSPWRQAASATLHCLTGCAIGEVLGMIIGTALGWSNLPTVVLSIALAFVFGYSLTISPVLRAGVPFRQALGVALAADTVSITVMEILDNTVMVTVPGAMDAGLGNWLFWVALALSLAVAFVLTVPVNKWLIGRGKGHAVVHQYHH
ncbi:DUF4396 domain-containing protein [Actinokineospora auranticolor]|uniref:Uncharacterized protein DUF4396 n=1 Tax=Actinokineospora auranticolor TaxID=155976 RepID=A0A2S6GV62_9PSEU|nr:DUF4396 domain-containing protein [Actinokineospora auranticolor]PPK69104.1 uncharacterized protein DUF4396 [Actinokineospora auranticolor]